MNDIEEKQIQTEREVRRLKSDFLDKFFITKEQTLWEALQEIKVGDTESLTQLHMTLRAIQSLKQEVQNALDSGKMSRANNS